MKFCSHCGSDRMVWKVPDGDNRPRHVCDACGAIYYQNPNIVAGCIPVFGERILLCKRAIEPRYGLWTLPAGFMENGETTAEAAARETWEEACCEVDELELFAVFNLPQINQVYMMFRASMPTGKFAPGEESLACELVTEDDIPWSELAFPTITHSLKFWLADREAGHFGLHFGDITREGNDSVFHDSRVNPHPPG